MRLLIRLTILALAGYGGWMLSQEYGGRVKYLREPMKKFSDRAAAATRDAAGNVEVAANQAAAAVKDSTVEVERAAKDAVDEASRSLASTGSEPSASRSVE
jgi:hypothetical protein